MTTATAAQQTEPATEPIPLAYDSGPADTGPMRVLQLIEEDGHTQTEVGRELHISQPQVSRLYKQARNIREAMETRKAQHRAYAMIIMYAILTACAVVSTTAWAWMAWALSARPR